LPHGFLQWLCIITPRRVGFRWFPFKENHVMESGVAGSQQEWSDGAFHMCVADCHFPSLAQNPKFVQSAVRGIAYPLISGDSPGGKRIKQFDQLNLVRLFL
jgi:hypothetical protein